MSEYLVNSAEVAESKRGNKYLRLKLFAPGGKAWDAMMWDSKEPPPVGSIIDALAEIDDYQGKKQLKITTFKVTDKDPSDVFLPKTPYDIEELYAELIRFQKSVEGKLGDLLYKAVGDPRWKRTPAAKIMHHAYIGGLLEHTVNLCRLVSAVCELYPGKLNRDLLLTYAILHDIGKQEEIECGTTIEFGTQGVLLGHISISYARATAWMTELEFDAELKMLVQHGILSHHGNKSYGSPVEPATLEAQVFSDIDGIDAHIGKILNLIGKTTEGKEWSEPADYKTKFYLGAKKT